MHGQVNDQDPVRRLEFVPQAGQVLILRHELVGHEVHVGKLLAQPRELGFVAAPLGLDVHLRRRPVGFGRAQIDFGNLHLGSPATGAD